MNYLFASSGKDKLKDIVNSLPNQGGFEPLDLLPYVYGIMGLVAVVVIIKAGFSMMLANGDPAKLAKARTEIMYALIGLVVVLLAASITFFVVTNLAQAGA